MIYAMHGIVSTRVRDRFIHRSMLDENAFVRWLDKQEEKLGSLQDAIEGKCDALTIDDATVASARAAMVAVAHGHAATLFVNPYYVASGAYYFFALLNFALDATRLSLVSWYDSSYDLSSKLGKWRFRGVVKDQFRSCVSEEERNALIQQCLEALEVSSITPPEHLQTLTLQALVELRTAGIAIENHGWTHGEVAAADASGIDSEIIRGKTWLREHITTDADYYAVPFGETLPPPECTRNWKTWFLLTNEKPLGWVSDGIYNRENLS